MGNFSKINHDEIYKLGYEWALEGMDTNKFKGSPEEKIIFIEGYKAALNEQKNSIKNNADAFNSQTNIEDEKGFGMAA